LADRSRLRLILGNSAWVVSERAIRLGVSFLITVWIARYFGPAVFGLLSFGLAWVSIFAVIGRLGLEGIVVRELIALPDNVTSILGSALVLRVFGGLFAGSLALLVYGVSFGISTDDQFLIILLLSLAEVFLAGEIFEYWFRSKVQFVFVFRAKLVAFAMASVFKIILLCSGTTIVWIASITLVEAALVAGLLFWEWRRHPESQRRLQVRVRTIRKLLGDAWPNLLTGIAILIYLRVDQVMIGSLLSSEEVGNYSVAVKLSEIWYVLPVAICQSVFPSLVERREREPEEYKKGLLKLTVILFWSSIPVAAAMTVLGPLLVEAIFGPAYGPAGTVLPIHFWGGCFVVLGMVGYQWHLAENKLKTSLARTVIGASANIILNIILIPRYGITGAAVATLISFGISDYLSAALFKNSRPIWFLLNKGIFTPWKVIS
jgi:O-antigen/teichoic acid export membrane protein